MSSVSLRSFPQTRTSSLIPIRVVWGVIWLIQAFAFFVAGVLIGLVAFKVRTFSRTAEAIHDNVTLATHLAGIRIAAGRRLEALPARARIKRRDGAAARIVPVDGLMHSGRGRCLAAQMVIVYKTI